MIKLIIGLGNPGKEHKGNRHNAGADFVKQLARKQNTLLKADKKYFGLTGKASFNKQEVLLLIPTTYMNLSGQAVSAVATFFKLTPKEILVCHDELDFPPGKIRLKQGGGHGGHNGLRDIMSALGNNKNFFRLRIGIGHPGDARRVADYVLKRAPQNEAQLIEQSLNAADSVISDIINDNLEKAMHQLHST